MAWSNDDRLYNLLPAVYQVRDAAQGEPLRALLSVIESEMELLEADIEGLYDNWFIETCADWVIPYIADLLGARAPFLIESQDAANLRAYTANTLRYRRRKGTPAVLEQLTRDVTGWPARVVEFFQRLGASQHLNHVRLNNLRSPDLRNTAELELIGTPFEIAAHTPDVRWIVNSRGKYNIPNVGLFVWRLQPYPVSRSTARLVGDPANGCYTFDPLGMDVPLFNREQTELEITHLAEEVNAPGRLRRRALYDDLEAVRQALVAGKQTRSGYLTNQPVLQVYLVEQFDADHRPVAVPSEKILVCNLTDWRRPPATVGYKQILQHVDGTQTIQQVLMPIAVAVDPELGRIAFPNGSEPKKVHVSYAYGFSGDVGAGPYDRRERVNEFLSQGVDWQVGVAQSPDIAPVGGDQICCSLSEAVRLWNTRPGGQRIGVIAIMDSYIYAENLTGAAAIAMSAGSRLLIVAADWPIVDIADSYDQHERKRGQLVPTGLRPHVLGDISVRGTAPGESADTGELFLNGLLIEGKLSVLIGNLGQLRLDCCTLSPGFGGLAVAPSITPGKQNDRLQVTLSRTMVEGVDLSPLVPRLAIIESIVARPGGDAVKAPGSEVGIGAGTVLGTVNVRSLDASNSIFAEPVMVERSQDGCIRFSYVPEGSRTPRCYRCQPDMALAGVADPVVSAAIRARLTPVFTSTRFGDPGYLQLSEQCASEIRTGAADGAEMGVFNHLKQPQRVANLRAALQEYCPFGLETGIFFVT